MLFINNTRLTKCEVSTHKAIKRVLSLSIRHSNIDVLYVPTSLKKNRTRMLKSLSILEKMHPDDTNVSECSVIDKYEINQISYINVLSRLFIQLCQQKGRCFVNRT